MFLDPRLPRGVLPMERVLGPKTVPQSTGQSKATTSVLTAAAFIYAIGAGITAAAGTRLALQWFLVERFNLHSFRSRADRL